MTMSEKDQGSSAGTTPEEPTRHPEQEHPAHDAHGGSMAPGLVDDTGDLVEEPPPSEAGR
jgi:hypothetical protein